jgi:CheY-like chemotaxis protein/anti-sigma regulatory factor (Ser/Thr protein kinase)
MSERIRRRILLVEDNEPINDLLRELLAQAGYDLTSVYDGEAALTELDSRTYDLVLLDLDLPKVSGQQILEHLRLQPASPKVIVMTGDDTPETILKVVQQQAYQFISKPAPPRRFIEAVQQALSVTGEPQPIELVSAKPDWIELLVPCQLEMADRVDSFIHGFNAKLSPDIRDSIGSAFRELLMNAIEWGGQLDPSRKVRITCIRSERILLYRIQDPGPGFRPSELQHAAVGNDPEKPYAHIEVRSEKGIRPGGFGLMMTRTFVDELIYNEHHNEVVFIKYL